MTNILVTPSEVVAVTPSFKGLQQPPRATAKVCNRDGSQYSILVEYNGQYSAARHLTPGHLTPDIWLQDNWLRTFDSRQLTPGLIGNCVRSQLSWSLMSGVNCPGVNCPESNVLESNVLESNVGEPIVNYSSSLVLDFSILELAQCSNTRCITSLQNWIL